MKWFWKKVKNVNVPHPIQLLPRELRGEIFNKLEQKEVSNVRLVCKQWAQDTKDYYSYQIDLINDSSDLDYLLQLRIYSLIIRKDRRIQISPDPDPDPGSKQLTFKYPNVIREIAVGRVAISVHHLHELIILCQKNLTHLDLPIIPSYSTSPDEFPTPTRPYQLPNLKICYLSFRFGDDGEPTAGSFLWSMFVSSNIPKLQELYLQLMGQVDENRILKGLAKLMTKNPKGLKVFNITTTRTVLLPVGRPPQPFSSSELLALSKVDQIRNLVIIEYIAYTDRSELHYVYLDMFKNLIRQQGKLEKLVVFKTLPISGDLLRSTILRNFETVAMVRVDVLVISAETPFDLSVFNNCSKLKELELSCKDANTDPPIGPELINLDELPNCIVNLKFANIDILSRDILRLLNSDALHSLEILELDKGRVGPSGDFGANFAVLAKIKGLEMKTSSRTHRYYSWKIAPIHSRRTKTV